jgi:plasmid stabilization system protein ParE
MKVIWTSRAKSDLVDISRWIAGDNPTAARIWADRLKKRAKDAGRNPRAVRIVPEIKEPRIREVLLKNYRIIYLVGERRIEILTIFEGHREIPMKKEAKK